MLKLSSTSPCSVPDRFLQCGTVLLIGPHGKSSHNLSSVTFRSETDFGFGVDEALKKLRASLPRCDSPGVQISGELAGPWTPMGLRG